MRRRLLFKRDEPFGSDARRREFLATRSLRSIALSASILFTEMFVGSCFGDASLIVDARPDPAQVFLGRGTITISYTITLAPSDGGTDGSGPVSAADTIRISVSGGDLNLGVQPVEKPPIGQSISEPTTISGTLSFYNPRSQFLQISGSGLYVTEVSPRFPSIYPSFREWIVLGGQTTINGADNPGPPQGSLDSQSQGPTVITAPSNIHAVIISGLSDPARVISSPNVTLTGGIVALGKNASTPSTPSTWSRGLRIIPDYSLVTGEKIPPVTPNIIDVRIVRQDVTADFPSSDPRSTN
jgi:hypothetical protein